MTSIALRNNKLIQTVMNLSAITQYYITGEILSIIIMVIITVYVSHMHRKLHAHNLMSMRHNKFVQYYTKYSVYSYILYRNEEVIGHHYDQSLLLGELELGYNIIVSC